jgi:hypothetical protein
MNAVQVLTARPDPVRPPGGRPGRVWTVEQIRALGMTCDGLAAGSVLGISRSLAYAMVRDRTFLVRVLRFKRAVRVWAPDLLHYLGVDPDPGPPAGQVSAAADPAGLDSRPVLPARLGLTRTARSQRRPPGTGGAGRTQCQRRAPPVGVGRRPGAGHPAFSGPSPASGPSSPSGRRSRCRQARGPGWRDPPRLAWVTARAFNRHRPTRFADV